MDYLKLVNEIKKLNKEQIKKRAKIVVVDILNEFTKIYKTTDLFEKHNLMPWELLLRLSYASIAGDNKVNVNEYELFVEITEGLIDKPSPKQLVEEIKNCDLQKTINIVDDFIDTLGKKMAQLKENLVEYAICFAAIDGTIDDGELYLIKKLAQ
ncbi:MAG: TerB family tellurite resistance protein [Acholeplasmatales bacterium]|nr:TerB family tellurite resistance protein [Acholeplasmatales bacterium]